MLKIKDKWFAANSFVLALIILFDFILTLGGLNLGYEEGNPLIVWGINAFGVLPSFIVLAILSFGIVFALVLLRERIEREWEVRMLYFGLSVLIMWRAFAIGMWVGIHV